VISARHFALQAEFLRLGHQGPGQQALPLDYTEPVAGALFKARDGIQFIGISFISTP